MNVSKLTQKKPFIILLGVALVGIPLTVYLLLQQQIFRPFAFSTQQFASAECATGGGSAVITVSFANTESTKDMNVTVNDLQTGKFIDLGTVKHQEVKTGQIVTGKSSLGNGSVLFKLTWTDKSPGDTIQSATYKALSGCSGSDSEPSSDFCPAGGPNQGVCRWDPLEGAEGYSVVVKDTQSGETIKSESVNKEASQSAFPMIPGKSYQCTITPKNACSTGSPVQSSEKICTVPTTPTPTPPLCPSDGLKQGICRWDALEGVAEYRITVRETTSGETVKTGIVKPPDTQFSFPNDAKKTYECTVTAANVCNESQAKSPPTSCTVPTPTVSATPIPSPTVTPTVAPTATPTPTPKPTATPTPKPTATPFPTLTPVVIVRTLTQPPQQPQPQTVQQQTQSSGGQSSTVQNAPQPQTVVQQSQPKYVQTTPVPTVIPTGNLTPTMLLVGFSTILLLAGGVIFFIL